MCLLLSIVYDVHLLLPLVLPCWTKHTLTTELIISVFDSEYVKNTPHFYCTIKIILLHPIQECYYPCLSYVYSFRSMHENPTNRIQPLSLHDIVMELLRACMFRKSNYYFMIVLHFLVTRLQPDQVRLH